MLNEQFIAGTHIELNGRALISHGRGPNGKVKLADLKNRTTQYHHAAVLVDAIASGRCRILDKPASEVRSLTIASYTAHVAPVAADLSMLSYEDQEQVKRSRQYVRAAQMKLQGCYGPKGLEPVIEEMAKELKDEDPPSWRTVIRWVKSFTASGIRGLIRTRGGNTHSRLDDLVEDLITRSLHERYLTLHRPTLKQTHLYLQGLVGLENNHREPDLHLFTPSYQTLKSRVSQLDRFEVLCFRYGPEYARKWFRTYRKSERPTRPLQVVQMDHTILDVEVTYAGVIRLGKPTITIARDVYSAAILAAYISFDPPSYQSVMRCLLAAILDKNLPTMVKDRVKHGWDTSGIPEQLLVDNGKEFVGKDLENACAHLDIDLVFCPPRKPWFKSQVERAFKVLRDQVIARLHGRTFTVKEEQGDRHADTEPLLDIEELSAVLMAWVIDVHHETPYVGTGLPPRIAWEQSIAATPPRTDVTPTEVRIYLGSVIRRALHPYGIEMFGLTYSSPELTLLRQQTERNPRHISREQDPDGEKFFVKYDPSDLGSIWVLDPLANLYVQADCSLKDYAKGLSKHRHKINRALARTRTKTFVDAKGLIEAHRMIDDMIRNLSVTAAERLGSSLARALPKHLNDVHDPEMEEELPVDAEIFPGEQQRTGDARSTEARADVDAASDTTPVTVNQAAPAQPVDADIDALADSWTKKEYA